MRKLGLVGGISWVSTIDYYRLINEGINEKLGGLNYAECIIYSLNFGDIQAVRWNNSFDLLHNACKSLKESGAEAIVLCANTAHFVADELQEAIDLPIIHLVSATVDALSKHHVRKAGLLGTKYTMEMDFFREGLKDRGVEPIIPELEETRDFIQHTLEYELGKGVMTEETRQAYISIMNEMIENGAEAIILACTEIPMFIQQSEISVPIFDTMKIHSQAAVPFALSQE